MLVLLRAMAMAGALSLFCAAAQAQQGAPARPPSGMGGQVPAAAPPGQAAPPQCDANCVRANAARASEACATKIEAQAPRDFDWITRPNPGIFQQADPSSAADSVVRYRGDSIRFMAADHSWSRVSYECSYDARTQAVVSVKVRAGRLDQPAPLATPALATPSQLPPPPAPLSPAQAPAATLSPMQVKALQALQQQQAQVKKPRPHVGEPSPVTIQQEVWNPKP